MKRLQPKHNTLERRPFQPGRLINPECCRLLQPEEISAFRNWAIAVRVQGVGYKGLGGAIAGEDIFFLDVEAEFGESQGNGAAFYGPDQG